MKNGKKRSVEQSEVESVTAFAIATQVGLGMVLPLVAGGLIGWYLDAQVFHNTFYIVTLLGLLLGLLAGAYGLIRLMDLLSKQ